MPCCCVVGCSERTEKGVRVFLLPSGKKNAERAKKWKINIKRQDLPEKAYVCERHFTFDQFENNRVDNKRPLRWDAVPTIFAHAKPIKERKPPMIRDAITSLNENTNVEEDLVPIAHSLDESNQFEEEENPQVQVLELKRKLQLAHKKNSSLIKEMKVLEHQINKLFNEDQIDFLRRGRMTGRQWHINTIKKCLKIYLSCGTTGYEELKSQNYPIPSIRTLQRRIENMKFRPGILDDLFPLLQSKTECMKPEEKHAVLLLDEMALKPGFQFDNSTGEIVGKPTISTSCPDNKVATHALVFMLAGLTTRWKQTIAYEYTANSYDASEANKIVNEIIKKCKAIDLNICAVVSDMGPQNQAMWRLNGIVCSRHSKIVNFCAHPCPSETMPRLYFMPDPPHVFKNLRLSLTEGNSFYLSKDVVQRFSLPSNEINLVAVRLVIAEDRNRDLKLASRLTVNIISPGHFDKMSVGFALALINRDVAAAIRYCINENLIDKKHSTTAWFFELMHKWFCILNCRSYKLALNLNNEDEYKDTILFLQSVMFVFENMKVGEKGHWKPFQTGVMLATKTVLDIQNTLLHDNNFNYLMLGRFTQDALENLFSNVRSRNPIPDAKEFKTALRLITVSQFFSPPKHGSYNVNDSEQLIDFLKSKKGLDPKIDDDDEEIDEDFICDFEDDVIVTSHEEQSLYYLLGSILLKIKNNFKTCDDCWSSVITNDSDASIQYISKLVKLKCYKQNSLVYASDNLYKQILQAEKAFRGSIDKLIDGRIQLSTLVSKFISSSKLNILDCHAIGEKILNKFFKTRMYFLLKKHSIAINNVNKESSKCGSRSVGMRVAVKRI